MDLWPMQFEFRVPFVWADLVKIRVWKFLQPTFVCDSDLVSKAVSLSE